MVSMWAVHWQHVLTAHLPSLPSICHAVLQHGFTRTPSTACTKCESVISTTQPSTQFERVTEPDTEYANFYNNKSEKKYQKHCNGHMQNSMTSIISAYNPFAGERGCYVAAKMWHSVLTGPHMHLLGLGGMLGCSEALCEICFNCLCKIVTGLDMQCNIWSITNYMWVWHKTCDVPFVCRTFHK